MGRQEKRDQEKESSIEEEAISEIRDVRSKDWVGSSSTRGGYNSLIRLYNLCNTIPSGDNQMKSDGWTLVLAIVFLAVLLYLIFGDFYLRVFLWIFNAIEYIWSQVGVKI